MGQYPMKHIPIRVPWHDSGWNGTVCKEPCFNDSCLKLPRKGLIYLCNAHMLLNVFKT